MLHMIALKTVDNIRRLTRWRLENYTWQDIAVKLNVTPVYVYRLVNKYAPELKETSCVTTVKPYRRTPLTVKQKFWQQVNILSNEECWNWLAATSSEKSGSPYGRMYCKWTKRSEYSHHLAYWLANGRRAKQWVLHHCGNSLCCNPNHLYEGTPQQNATDRQTHFILKHKDADAMIKKIQAVRYLKKRRRAWY